MIVSNINLIGDKLPNVYIHSIIIDQHGADNVENAGVADPHIDVSEEPVRIQNRDGSFTLRYPPINFTSKALTSSALIINLKLMLKDTQKQTWSVNEEVMKYLRLRVVQSTDARFTSQINRGDFPLDPKMYATSRYAKSATEKVFSVREEMGAIEEYELVSDVNNNKFYNITFEKTFSLPTLTPKHLNYFAMVYFDFDQLEEDYGLDLNSNMKKTIFGNLVSESVIHQGRATTTAHAYLLPNNELYAGPVHKHQDRWMVGAYHTETPHDVLKRVQVPNTKLTDLRDLESLKDTQIDFSQIEAELLNIQSDINIFTNDSLSVFGVRPNYFTDLMLSRTAQGDACFMFGVEYRKVIKDKTKLGKLISSNDTAIIESLLQRCKIRNIKFFRNRIIRREKITRLGNKTISTERMRNTLQGDYGSAFDYVPSVMIAYNSQNAPGRMKESKIYKDDYSYTITDQAFAASIDKEISKKQSTIQTPDIIGAIRETNLSVQDNNPGMRFFTGIDDEMSEITDGLYQYSVRIEIEDDTQSYLMELLQQLNNAKVQLENYYNEAKDPVNYNYRSKKFKKQYIESLNNRFPIISNPSPNVATAKNAPYVDPIVRYLDILNVITLNSYANRIDKLSKVLYASISPQSGSPDGINSLINMISALIIKIRDLFDTNATDYNQSGGKFGSKATQKQTSNSKTIVLEKEFDAIFDSNILKHTGYDYIEASPTEPGTGLKVVDGSLFAERCQAETLKYFNSPSTAINLSSNGIQYLSDNTNSTELTYLSPAMAQVDSQTIEIINMGHMTVEPTQYQLFESMVTSYNLSSKPVRYDLRSTIDTTTEKTSKSYSNVIAAAGATISTVYDYNNMIAQMESDDGLLPIRDVLSENSHEISGNMVMQHRANMEGMLETPYATIRKQSTGGGNAATLMTAVMSPSKTTGFGNLRSSTLTSDTSVENSMFTSDTPINQIRLSTAQTIQQYNIGQNDNVIEQQGSSPISSDVLSTVPNQIKSLMLASVDTSNTLTKYNWFNTQAQSGLDVISDPTTEAMFRINYQLLQEIQVMSGFTVNSAGEAQLKSPEFVQLTIDMFNESIGKVLLCRMSTYENEDIGVADYKGIELPIYNEFFLLTPQTQIYVSNAQTVPTQFTALINPTFRSTYLNTQDKVVTSLRMGATTNTRRGNERTKISNEYLTTTVPVEKPNTVDPVTTQELVTTVTGTRTAATTMTRMSTTTRGGGGY